MWTMRRDQGLLASSVAPSSWVPSTTLGVRVTRVWSNDVVASGLSGHSHI
jgi:hypothetical protein